MIRDRATLQEQLAEAERKAAEVFEEIRRQRELVSRLERNGQDASPNKVILFRLEQMEVQHLSERVRLISALWVP